MFSEIIELLLDAGPDARPEDQNVSTAVDDAASYELDGIAQSSAWA